MEKIIIKPSAGHHLHARTQSTVRSAGKWGSKNGQTINNVALDLLRRQCSTHTHSHTHHYGDTWMHLDRADRQLVSFPAKNPALATPDTEFNELLLYRGWDSLSPAFPIVRFAARTDVCQPISITTPVTRDGRVVEFRS